MVWKQVVSSRLGRQCFKAFFARRKLLLLFTLKEKKVPLYLVWCQSMKIRLVSVRTVSDETHFSFQATESWRQSWCINSNLCFFSRSKTIQSRSLTKELNLLKVCEGKTHQTPAIKAFLRDRLFLVVQLNNTLYRIYIHKPAFSPSKTFTNTFVKRGPHSHKKRTKAYRDL